MCTSFWLTNIRKYFFRYKIPRNKILKMIVYFLVHNPGVYLVVKSIEFVHRLYSDEANVVHQIYHTKSYFQNLIKITSEQMISSEY